MTYITHNTYYAEHILECSGHTGFAKRGNDILCSAISILILTLHYYLTEAEKNGLVSNLISDIHSGYANIRFICEGGSEADKCFSAITGGFRMLAESFPDYIFYEE